MSVAEMRMFLMNEHTRIDIRNEFVEEKVGVATFDKNNLELCLR